MPEGDTIHRAARALAARLVGKTIEASSSTLPRVPTASLVGKTIEAVEAHGKNLVVRFDDGRILRTHMRMTGSWHMYKPGERWRVREERARMVLAVEGTVAVCFDAPVVEVLRAPEAKRVLDELGPDILSPSFDAAGASLRLRRWNDVPIADAITDQRAIAGIGNVYKSEVLFLQRAPPAANVSCFAEAELRAIVEKARDLMRRNLDPNIPTRITRGAPGGRLWVYGRGGDACFTCGETIRATRQGDLHRITYDCPRCQPARTPPERD